MDFSRDTIFLEHTNELPSFEIATNFLGAPKERITTARAVDFELLCKRLWSYKKLRSCLVNLEELLFVAPLMDAAAGRQR